MKRLLPLGAGLAGATLLIASAVWLATDHDAAAGDAGSAPTAAIISTSTEQSDAKMDATHDHTDGAHMDHTDHADHMDHAMHEDSADTSEPMDGPEAADPMAGMGDGHSHDALGPLSQRQAAASEDELRAADELWSSTRASVAIYGDIENALAAGFRANPNEVGRATVHYPHAANRRDDRQLDPMHPEGLVYRFNADGSATLLGVVFTVAAGEPAPTPAGPIFDWHTHDTACPSFLVPAGECVNTFRMLHVWTADPVVDPFTQPFAAAVATS